MYQCQMAKQTMGFSLQALKFRADQKHYHLQTPQTPIVRTNSYTKYNIDEYPTGTNAIVAVLAYTGYDMEDAIILNKSSLDHGMCHGQIYQVDQGQKLFRRNKDAKSLHSVIDSDGLPYVGQMIHPGEPYCSIYDKTTNFLRTNSRKGSESVFVNYAAVDMKNCKTLPQKVSLYSVIQTMYTKRIKCIPLLSIFWYEIGVLFYALCCYCAAKSLYKLHCHFRWILFHCSQHPSLTANIG